MTDREPSKTAAGVAVLRAVHQLIDGTPKILDDPVILQLLDAQFLQQVEANPIRFSLPSSLALRAHVLIRSRYAEDQLALAVKRGIRQFISLGAGLDTFAYRQPEWAHHLKIFEVDQPASQREKQERLQKAGIAIPDNVQLVPVDFETTAISEGLRQSGFDPTLPTFVSWLGVMVYLSQEAIDAVFRFVLMLPSGSEIVFTFTQPPTTDPVTGRARSRMAERAALVGEPWQTRITPEDLVNYLQNLGFSEITIPTPAEIDALYIQNRKDGLHAAPRSSLARAIV